MIITFKQLIKNLWIFYIFILYILEIFIIVDFIITTNNLNNYLNFLLISKKIKYEIKILLIYNNFKYIQDSISNKLRTCINI